MKRSFCILLVSLIGMMLYAYSQDSNAYADREQISTARHSFFNINSAWRDIRIQEGTANRRDSLEAIAEELAQQEQYNLADSVYQEALKLYKQCGETDTKEYVSLLYSMTTLYLNMGDYAQADYYENEARSKGGNIYSFIQVISDYLNSSSREEEDIIGQIDSLRSLLGKNNDGWADMWRSWGEEEYAQELEKEAYIRNYTNYAKGLTSLAEYYIKQRKYNLAEPLLLEADSIIHQYAPHDSTLFIQGLVAFGKLYMGRNDLVKAETYLKEAYDICLKKKIPTNYVLDNIDETMGDLYQQMEDYQKAEQFLIKSKNKLKLSRLYETMGNIEQASLSYEDYLKSSSNYSPSYILALENVGMFYYRQKRIVEAYSLFEKSLSLRKNEFYSSVNFLSESQRVKFWNSYNTIYSTYYASCLYSQGCANKAYDLQLFTKGLLLTSDTHIRYSIMNSNDAILQKDYKNFVRLKTLIYEKESNGVSDSEIKMLKQRAEYIEKDIIHRSSSYRENKAQSLITWDSVRSHLTPNQVAIEYMEMPINDDSTLCCALLLRDTCSHPIMIPLFAEKDILPLMNTSDIKPINNTYGIDGNGKLLTQKVWGRILPYIKKGETIYFSPSGVLYQLAIEALPYDNSHTMADMYNMVRLSSTREIAMHKNDIHYTSATLYGGIQYDLDTTILKAESKKYPEVAINRGIENDTLNRGNIDFLKWTQTEVENINLILKQNNLQVQLITSTNANEESFKALSGKHQNILHIATHGFFWNDSTAHKKEYFSQRMMTLEEDMPSIDPLNRCGLLFAGAQTAWSGRSTELPDGVQDGILTAKEISLLDFRDANLVVLSACETGKGEITGDGVFGLQRAFKQAGAQTIIMSLWPVHDASAPLLMTEFYKNWITKGQSKHEALHNAQETVRTTRDKKNQLIYSAPYYWAGFIVVD